MTVKEHLVKLFLSVPPVPLTVGQRGGKQHFVAEHYADHLIAHGVTVGKPLTEYLHPVDNYAGLKGKYLVFKADTGEQVTNCFVLRPDKDATAVEALRCYAHATDNKTLSNDIYNWVGKGVSLAMSEMSPTGCHCRSRRKENDYA